MAKLPTRKNVRLKTYDYSQPGAYFVTICSEGRKPIFGNIDGIEITLTDAGEFVKDKWLENSRHYPGLTVDEFIVMPNHLHGILMLDDSPDRLPIHEIIRRYKSITTIAMHKKGLGKGDVWQRNYFEHVLRNDRDLANARAYIANNALRWHLDRLNPEVDPHAIPDLVLPGGLVTF